MPAKDERKKSSRKLALSVYLTYERAQDWKNV